MNIKGNIILLIDDTPPIRYFMRVTLEHEGATCLEASCIEDGIMFSKQYQPDTIVVDIDLPEENMLSHIKALKELPHAPAIITLTVHHEKPYLDKAIRHGADAILCKPFVISELLETIEHISENTL